VWVCECEQKQSARIVHFFGLWLGLVVTVVGGWCVKEGGRNFVGEVDEYWCVG